MDLDGVCNFEFSTHVIITNDTKFGSTALFGANKFHNEMITVLPNETQLSAAADYDMIRWTGSSSEDDEENDLYDETPFILQTVKSMLPRSSLGDAKDKKLQIISNADKNDNESRIYQYSNNLPDSSSAKENHPPVIKSLLWSLIGSPPDQKREPLFTKSPIRASSPTVLSPSAASSLSSKLLRTKAQHNTKAQILNISRNPTFKSVGTFMPAFESPLKCTKPQQSNSCLRIQPPIEGSLTSGCTSKNFRVKTGLDESLLHVSSNKVQSVKALRRQNMSYRAVTPDKVCGAQLMTSPTRAGLEQSLQTSPLRGQVVHRLVDAPAYKIKFLAYANVSINRNSENPDAKSISLANFQVVIAHRFPLLQMLILIYIVTTGFNFTSTSTQLESYAPNYSFDYLAPHARNSLRPGSAYRCDGNHVGSNPTPGSISTPQYLMSGDSTKICIYLNRFSGIHENIGIVHGPQACPGETSCIQSRFKVRVSLISLLLTHFTAAEIAQPRFV